MTRIFLIGYMGAGKSFIGKQLAKRLNCSFVDMDWFIENRYHKPVHEIFAKQGETYFRVIERKILLEVVQFEHTVISTGGGVPCFFDNMDVINRAGISIYLQTPADELIRRLLNRKQKRPLIKDKSLEELKRYIVDTLTEREKWYKQASITFPVQKIQTQEDLETLIQQINNTIHY